MDSRKKELINAYKMMYRSPGVLAIRNLVNGKIFIDGSHDVSKLSNRLRAELTGGGHMNKELQADWNKYGAANFKFEILEEITESNIQNFDYNYALKCLLTSWMEKLSPHGDQGYHN